MIRLRCLVELSVPRPVFLVAGSCLVVDTALLHDSRASSIIRNVALNTNLKEVVELLLTEGEPHLEGEFIGIQTIAVT